MKLSEGAEAKIYLVRISGSEFIMKRREEKRYRVKELDERIRTERTRAEARIMLKLARLGMHVPRLIAIGRFSICMERLYGGLLKDTKPKAETLREAGAALAAMHENNVAHGDFTPANLMLCGKELYVIDFGLSEVTSSVEEKALDLLLMKRSLPRAPYLVFEESYSRSCSSSRQIINRLKAIEKRGRYQTRTLNTSIP